MTSVASDIGFTPAVKAIQARKGSRAAYARMEQGAGWSTTIDDAGAARRVLFLCSITVAGKVFSPHVTRTDTASRTT